MISARIVVPGTAIGAQNEPRTTSHAVANQRKCARSSNGVMGFDKATADHLANFQIDSAAHVQGHHPPLRTRRAEGLVGNRRQLRGQSPQRAQDRRKTTDNVALMGEETLPVELPVLGPRGERPEARVIVSPPD